MTMTEPSFGLPLTFDQELLRLDYIARAHRDLYEARSELGYIKSYMDDKAGSGLHGSRAAVLRMAVDGWLEETRLVTVNGWRGLHVVELMTGAADTLRRVRMLRINVELGDPEDAWGGNEEEEARHEG